MKQFYKSITPLLLLLPISSASIAETPDTPMAPMGEMNMNKGMGMHQGMGMMHGMTEEQKDQQLRSFQDHLLKMHDLSNQILSEKDPAKQEQLKNKQLELMKAHQAKMMEHRMQKMMSNQHKMQSKPMDNK